MSQQKPNILIIHADQHRWDCLGANGNKQIKTPNIDALAKDGVLYPESFSSFPVCTPSRYSLITGLCVHQHLGYSNHSTIPSALPTFPKLLREAGYRTKAVGKMHFTPTYLDVGFDEMQLAEQDGPGRHDDDYHRWLRQQGLVDGIDLMDQVKEYREQAPREYWQTYGAGPSDLSEHYHSTTWIAERAIETLEEWDNNGNLLMVGFIKPHHPFDPPEPWDKLYDPNELELLPGWCPDISETDLSYHSGYFPYEGLGPDRIKHIMAHYYASITQIDHHVGRMIQLLKDKGLYKDTLIVYTSDHGDYMGYRHLVLKAGYLYDALAKVPLIIKFPVNNRAGEVCDNLVSNIDLAPTLLSIAGCTPDKSMNGLNLTNVSENRNIIFSEDGKHFMARTKKRKLLYKQQMDKCQFFDLEKDPLELHNLFTHQDYQNEINEYINALGRWLLFEAKSPTYLDQSSPVISRKNVPNPNDNHLKESEQYFRQKMQGLFN